MKIIEKVRLVKEEIRNDQAKATANATKAMLAIHGGIQSDAWFEYVQQFQENADQLARLMGTDGTGQHQGLSIKRAYLAANAMCGPGSTDELDRQVETIDDPPTP